MQCHWSDGVLGGVSGLQTNRVWRVHSAKSGQRVTLIAEPETRSAMMRLTSHTGEDYTCKKSLCTQWPAWSDLPFLHLHRQPPHLLHNKSLWWFKYFCLPWRIAIAKTFICFNKGEQSMQTDTLYYLLLLIHTYRLTQTHGEQHVEFRQHILYCYEHRQLSNLPHLTPTQSLILSAVSGRTWLHNVFANS